MDGFDGGKASEVADVEREEMSQAVDRHGNNQPGVVDLYAADTARNEKATPLLMDEGSVGKEDKAALKPSHPPVGFSHGQAKASSCRYRAGADIPELTKNLGCETEAVPSGP
jgi:hypothetical protein